MMSLAKRKTRLTSATNFAPFFECFLKYRARASEKQCSGGDTLVFKKRRTRVVSALNRMASVAASMSDAPFGEPAQIIVNLSKPQSFPGGFSRVMRLQRLPTKDLAIIMLPEISRDLPMVHEETRLLSA